MLRLAGRMRTPGPGTGREAEPSALLGEGICVCALCISLQRCGALPLLLAACHSRRKAPLSGYLLGNPVPAERGWMEPRWSAVPHGDGMELHVPPCPGLRQYPQGLPGTTQSCSHPLSLRYAKPTPKPPALLCNVFRMHVLQRAYGRSTHGPPPSPQKHSWTTTTTTLAGPTHTLLSHGCLQQESHSLCWSWRGKTAWYRRDDNHLICQVPPNHEVATQTPRSRRCSDNKEMSL